MFFLLADDVHRRDLSRYQVHRILLALPGSQSPGFWFEEAWPGAANIQMFFVFYFIMTGLHALHMIIGIGVLSVLLFRTLLGSFTAEYHTPIDLGGLYWHFIDIVWVFLYAIFYIPGLHVK